MRSRHVRIGEMAGECDEPVVVIDVLRAFTTAPWVLAGRASTLVLARSPVDALSLKSRLGSRAVAISDGELSSGFEFGNSPAQVQRFDVADRPVVLTTRNGTVGVHAVRRAPLVLCTALVTAGATAQALLASGTDRVTYVITGDAGTAEEDAACADLIDALVAGRKPPGDTLERVQRSRAAQGLRDGIVAGFAGVDDDDIRMACEIDRFAFALEVRQRAGRVELVSARG